ncbi:MAG: acyl-CoA dehydrogenase family protein [Deltaproteobacteria bacterium]|nr:MAG: acyl-CoA dehydrogenase family protein [Deltaproteobacteria bacterium]
MDFELTDKQRMVKDTISKIMRREIIPVASEYDRTKALFDSVILKDLLDTLVPLGYLSHVIPEEEGGAGMDFITYGILMEELFGAYASLAMLVGTEIIACIVYEMGTPEQKKKFLRPVMTGEKIWCTAVTEPNAGSSTAEIETTAVLDGDDYVINGTKVWISAGSISDVALVLAQMEQDSEKAGLCHILVDREVSPYEATELPKLGVRSCPTSELIFKDCRVPKENLLVAPGAGLKQILHIFEMPRCQLCIGATGIAQAALDASIEYATQRCQFGKPIGSFQLIQQMIADMYADIEAARYLAYKGFSMLDKRVRCDKETSAAKSFGTEMAVRVTSLALRIHGANGLSEEYPVERYARDARSLTIPDGTTQMQKLIVARSLLGIDAFR